MRYRVGVDQHRAGRAGGQPMIATAHILLHGFGQRFDRPISLSLYLYAAGGVGFLSFVLVVLFAGDRVGEQATAYPRRGVPWLLRLAGTPWPRRVGGALGTFGVFVVTG